MTKIKTKTKPNSYIFKRVKTRERFLGSLKRLSSSGGKAEKAEDQTGT